ncbi:MAG TPA: hypothetical protein VH760_02240 [Gaiellaceae bacterium]
MRILFQLAFPGYLRMYGSTVRLLAERGHRVLLAYDQPEKRRDDVTVAALEAVENVELVRPLPLPRRPGEAGIERLRATADYLHYLDPRFADAPYLRRRLDKYLDGRLRMFAGWRYGHPLGRPALRLALALEHLVPSDRGVERALSALSPDVVVVSPLIGRSPANRRQTDTVKAARRLGIPTGFAVASWDHLTTKGVLKAQADAAFVWNDIQRRDAADIHRVPPQRVAVTGAQLFDHWFDRRPSATRSEFAAAVGLASDRYLLYVGSSPNVAPAEREIAFVRDWVQALRQSRRPPLREVGVLVRPHPYSVSDWAEVDLSALGGAVAPRTPPHLPMDADDEALYFHSIHFASAVVGINTSAMLESFVQRRPVLTIRSPAFRETQTGTPHFRELRAAAGGALANATTVDEHLAQLEEVLDRPERTAEQIDAFLRAFLRPHGLDRPATPILADAIEALGRSRRASSGQTGARA